MESKIVISNNADKTSDVKNPTLVSDTKKSMSTELGSSIMHQGLWAIIFSFIGLNQDLLMLRLVNKKWKSHVEYSNEVIMKMQQRSIEQKLKEIDELDEKDKLELKKAIDIQNNHEKLKQNEIDWRYLAELRACTKPPGEMLMTMVGLIHLLNNREQLPAKEMDWRHCMDLVIDPKKFLKILKQVTPKTINDDRVKRFEEHIQGITSERVDRQSWGVGYLLKWAISLVEVYKMERSAPSEVRFRLKQLDWIKEQEEWIGKFSLIQKKLLQKI